MGNPLIKFNDGWCLGGCLTFLPYLFGRSLSSKVLFRLGLGPGWCWKIIIEWWHRTFTCLLLCWLAKSMLNLNGVAWGDACLTWPTLQVESVLRLCSITYIFSNLCWCYHSWRYIKYMFLFLSSRFSFLSYTCYLTLLWYSVKGCSVPDIMRNANYISLLFSLFLICRWCACWIQGGCHCSHCQFCAYSKYIFCPVTY